MVAKFNSETRVQKFKPERQDANTFMWKKLSAEKLKVHKIENFFDSDFGICFISLLVMSKY